jgi:hypothetical protein
MVCFFPKSSLKGGQLKFFVQINAVLKITVINFMHQDTVSCQRHLLDYYYVHPVAALVCNLSKSICIMYLLYEDTVFLRIYIYARSYYR